jgi:hypothetical protein
MPTRRVEAFVFSADRQGAELILRSRARRKLCACAVELERCNANIQRAWGIGWAVRFVVASPVDLARNPRKARLKEQIYYCIGTGK